MQENEKKEYERQKKVLSLMITAHSTLRDYYACISKCFDAFLIIAAVFLNALVFAPDTFYVFFNFDPDSSKLYLGLISVLLFSLSIVGLVLNTKQKSENHSQASIQLFNLLSECRCIDDIPEGDDKNIKMSSFIHKYSEITSFMVPIPNKKFNRLKSKHLRKVEFSKFIEKHPGKLYIIQKIAFIINSSKKKDHE